MTRRCIGAAAAAAPPHCMAASLHPSPGADLEKRMGAAATVQKTLAFSEKFEKVGFGSCLHILIVERVCKLGLSMYCTYILLTSLNFSAEFEKRFSQSKILL